MVLAIEREPGQRRQWARVVARAWDDDGFRQRLLAEPESVLRDAGITLPPGVPVRVVEDDAAESGDATACLRLPARPCTGDLIEDDLGLPQRGLMGKTKTKPCLCINFCCV
jgi:hypothetical protein